MPQVDYLIIGGGIAGTTAAETIRSKDTNSSISLITEEEEQLYSRVMIRDYLTNEKTLDQLYLRNEKDYQEKNISFIHGERVTNVDFNSKAVTTDKNQIFNFNKLLLASGGKVTKLSLPGAGLSEVVYMRTLKDAKKIKELVSECKEAVVIGGGFIGLDFVQIFTKNGLNTTAIIREKYFWENMVGENSGILLSQILTENGVNILPESQAAEFIGSGKLEAVKLTNGNLVNADIAGVGIGINLDTEYLKDSGLVIKKGVVTNEYLETSIPEVWAAGDIAEFYDPIFKKYHTLGNWSNAAGHGRTAGANMVGEKNVYETTSLYSMRVFDSNFVFLGDQFVGENTQTLERGSVEDKKLARLLIREETVVGASLINLPAERAAINNLIKNKTKITDFKEKFKDLTFNLSTI